MSNEDEKISENLSTKISFESMPDEENKELSGFLKGSASFKIVPPKSRAKIRGKSQDGRNSKNEKTLRKRANSNEKKFNKFEFSKLKSILLINDSEKIIHEFRVFLY